jgi:hypothetical protein
VFGRRGDRFIGGTPLWIRALPLAAVAYLGFLVLAAATTVGGARMLAYVPTVAPNLMLLSVYSAIGWFLWRTQLRNRAAQGGWSLSGLTLGIVFPTCALMHAAWVVYAVAGVYAFDWHGFVIDWASVPAAFYFLWVVSSLYRGTLADWNQSIERRLGEAAPAS